MRAFIYFMAAGAIVLLAHTEPAPAKSCIKGAIAGGIGGLAGHHGLAAAAAGCVAARHLPNKRKPGQTNGHANPKQINEQDRTRPDRESMTNRH